MYLLMKNMYTVSVCHLNKIVVK